jgi:hypothetical protein
MNFFLQIDADGAVSPDHLVCADAGIGGHVSARIDETNMGWIVANGALRAVKRRSGKSMEKNLPCLFNPLQRPKLRRKHTCNNQSE